MRIKLGLLTILIIGACSATGYAGPASYLDVDSAARPSGMGSAFVAISDDINAPLFNPAGLANMELTNFMFGGTLGLLNENQYDNFYGIAQQLPPDSYLGFHAIQYGINNLSYAPGASISNFQDSEWSFGATYAYELDYQFKMGISSSFLYQDIVGLNARGFGGADIGLMVVPSLLYDINLGASVRHIGGFLTYDTGTSFPLNSDVRVGISDQLFNRQLTLDYDAEWQTQSNFNIISHAGLEWWSFDFLALRGGWDYNTPTLGLTIHWLNYGLDYAVRFQDYVGQGSLHRVAFTYAL
jgi:hypothetical protein